MRSIGLRGVVWASGTVAVLALAPLAVVAPSAAALGLAALAAVGAGLTYRRTATLAAAHEKLSAEIGVVAQRLLKLETVALALARQQVEAANSAKSSAEAAPGPAGPETAAATATETAALAAGIEEVTSEIGLLSGIVRELATVVAAQDVDIARLKSAPPPAQVPPQIAPVVPPAADGVAAPPPATPRPVAAFTPPAFRAPARDPGRASGDVAAAEAAVVDAFDGEGLDVWLQPVVSLPQRRVVSYEALARLKVGGEILAPEAFLSVLERHGRTTALDRRMLQRVATIARHLQGRGSPASVAYGLSPLSLFEPGFLRSLGRLVAEGGDLSGRVVVALPQSSWRTLDAEQAGVLAELRGRLGFILDRPTDLRFDPTALAERGVSGVKVPASLLLRPPTREAMPDLAVEDLVAALGRAGIRLVATGVATEAEVPDLIDLDVPLAQGPVFAAARAVRAEVLSAPPGAEPPAQPEPPPEPPPQRRPFRDFLRRAG